MIIGCPKEIKDNEHRVGLVLSSVQALVKMGHEVWVETNAGEGCHLSDPDYTKAGAKIVQRASDLWKHSDLIVKVKEPILKEYEYLQTGQALFTFLHLAADLPLTQVLLEKKIQAIAYETIQAGRVLPILRPMSEVAGRLATQMGAWCLSKHQGGKGILLSGVTGVKKAHVVIIGGGTVGTNAARVALGMGAQVTLLDTNLDRLEELDNLFGGKAQTLYSTPHTLEEQIYVADLVIGAVLVAGAKAPILVTENMVKHMSKGSVIVDVAVDQGGCVETLHITTHDHPTYLHHGVVHYGVSNMPGAVPQTSTFALSHAAYPYLMQLANKGVKEACQENPDLAKGINTYKGHVTYEAVAKAHQLPYTPLQEVM